MKLYVVNVGVPIASDVEVVLDSTGLIEGAPQLTHLFPAFANVMDFTFDQWYWDYLLKYDYPFMDLMRIIYPLYEGKNVALIYNPIAGMYNDYIESLLKFITCRYDILGNRIQIPEDNDVANESDFSIRGLYNLDLDKNRMLSLQMNGAYSWSDIPTPEIRTFYKKNA